MLQFGSAPTAPTLTHVDSATRRLMESEARVGRNKRSALRRILSAHAMLEYRRAWNPGGTYFIAIITPTRRWTRA